MCRCFDVVGISDSHNIEFPRNIRELVSNGKVFSGGRRHHDIMRPYLPDDSIWIDIAAPLEKVFERYMPHEKIVVFASGDPLFFGYASTLMKQFPDAQINVFPAFNSLQILAHRLCLPYESMVCVSLTGRPWHNFWEKIIRREQTVGVLTDKNNTPSKIASQLLKYGYDEYEINVGMNLGNEEMERIKTSTLPYAAMNVYESPNCVILRKVNDHGFPKLFGIPDDKFLLLDGRKNMITKMPIRLITLALLDLANRKSLWDIGFCTGSVSIEAKLQFPHLKITAFEKREKCAEIMKHNSMKMSAPGIDAVICDFFDVDLSVYPQPDTVFIGGHGGRLPEMLKRIAEYAAPGCVIVFNSVTDESKLAFITGVEAIGKKIVESHHIALDDFNPITILKAE